MFRCSVGIDSDFDPYTGMKISGGSRLHGMVGEDKKEKKERGRLDILFNALEFLVTSVCRSTDVSNVHTCSSSSVASPLS